MYHIEMSQQIEVAIFIGNIPKIDVVSMMADMGSGPGPCRTLSWSYRSTQFPTLTVMATSYNYVASHSRLDFCMLTYLASPCNVRMCI